jgi:hypothetical protein
MSPQLDSPCFHSLGYLIVQPPILFSLTGFFLWDQDEAYYLRKENLGHFDIMNPLYSFLTLSSSDIMASTLRLHPHNQFFGNLKNNAFTLFTCHSIIIISND